MAFDDKAEEHVSEMGETCFLTKWDAQIPAEQHDLRELAAMEWIKGWHEHVSSSRAIEDD
jgi:hypothetical protein